MERANAPTKLLLAAALGLAGLAASGRARADDTRTPTFFVTATGGYSVYKSQMVQSNDTSTTVAYGFGVYAGQQKNLGFLLNRETSSFDFALNKASLALEWQDMHVRYRYGPVYLGILITESHSTVTAPPDADGDDLLDQNADPVSFLDMSSSGYGGNVGARLPVAKKGEAYVDITYAAAGTVRETAADPTVAAANGDAIPGTREIGIGPRMDLDLGGSINMSRWLDVICGFKYRTYSLSVDGTSYAEAHNTTYVGFVAGWNF
jgi:hypothetical protein